MCLAVAIPLRRESEVFVRNNGTLNMVRIEKNRKFGENNDATAAKDENGLCLTILHLASWQRIFLDLASSTSMCSPLTARTNHLLPHLSDGNMHSAHHPCKTSMH